MQYLAKFWVDNRSQYYERKKKKIFFLATVAGTLNPQEGNMKECAIYFRKGMTGEITKVYKIISQRNCIRLFFHSFFPPP